MSRDQIKHEAVLLHRPGSSVRCVDDGERVVVLLEPYELPDGHFYIPSEATALAFIVPVLYPDAQPDPSGFYIKPVDLKVAHTGNQPHATSRTQLLGEEWLKFSWTPKGPQWDPASDTLVTYLATLEKRFLRHN